MSSERENNALAEWVYPGFCLGMGIVNVSMRIGEPVPPKLRNRYFWFMISALYLAKPLYLNIGGGFSYGNEERGYLLEPSRILHKSNISLNACCGQINDVNLLQYTAEDLRQAGVYFARIVEIFNSKKTAPRPYYVLKAFFEATLWERSVYASTSFAKLIPLLDSFAGNPTHKHEQKVSTRLSFFLKDLPCKFLTEPLSEDQIKMRLALIWQRHRGPDLHGYLKEPDVDMRQDSNKIPPDSEELKDLFDLMEVSRVAIVKMLLLDENSYREYCQIPIPKREYSSKNERVTDEAVREDLGKLFFEDKFYPHPKELLAYSDFKDFTNRQSETQIGKIAAITV
jgi:hypothetical protein